MDRSTSALLHFALCQLLRHMHALDMQAFNMLALYVAVAEHARVQHALYVASHTRTVFVVHNSAAHASVSIQAAHFCATHCKTAICMLAVQSRQPAVDAVKPIVRNMMPLRAEWKNSMMR